MRKIAILVTVAALGAVALIVLPRTAADSASPYTAWTAYQGGPHSSQFSSLSQINRSNVARLEAAWTFPAGESNVFFNPIIIGGVMYVLARDGEIVALDAATGEERWAHPNEGAVGGRGINYWQSVDGAERRLLYVNAGFLTAIDAHTGRTVTTFGDGGRVDLRKGLAASGWDVSGVRPLQTSNPGRVFEDLMIVSLPAQGAGYRSTPGHVHAYDVRSGELHWVFHSIPHPGEFGYDTWPAGAYKTAGGVHNWSELSIDVERGIAYIPFGSPRYDFYGGDRRGANLFGNSLVALDARTGKRLWHQQLVHHDLWDYDLPQSPKLLTIQLNGRPVDVVAQATKQGFLFVFERVTGSPIWPIEERPVPQSDVPGEHSWPTQPFPTKPPPFADQSFTADDINPFLPEAEQELLRARMRVARNEGLFTPPSLEGTILMPGHNGGANWGGSAVDPRRGELYIVSKNLPVMQRLFVTDEEPGIGGGDGSVPTAQRVARARAEAEQRAAEGLVRYASPYDFLTSPITGMSAIAPPWAHLTAYDLNTGEIRWRVPHGSVSAPPDLGIPADSGAHFPRSGPLVTGGGLVFAATGSDRMLRAYDRDSGAVLWETRLPAAAEGVPATYQVGGRQYLVLAVAAGSGMMAARLDETEEHPPGAYIAFALPER